MCRAILRDGEGRALQYDTLPGKVKVYFNEELQGPEPLVVCYYYWIFCYQECYHNNQIWESNTCFLSYFQSHRLQLYFQGKMYFVQYSDDVLLALKPQYICMRGENGRCSQSTYSTVYPMV